MTIDMHAAYFHRRKADHHEPCGRRMEEHFWNEVRLGQTVVLVICTSCGRLPSEILAMMPVM